MFLSKELPQDSLAARREEGWDGEGENGEGTGRP